MEEVVWSENTERPMYIYIIYKIILFLFPSLFIVPLARRSYSRRKQILNK
jgi:hypothetical protein